MTRPPGDASAEPLRQQLVKYLAEQFPFSTVADRQLGADGLLAIFNAHAERVRAEVNPPLIDRHTINLSGGHWTIAHPLSCRELPGGLFGCAYNGAARETLTGDEPKGTFYCTLDDDGDLTIQEPAQQAVAP